CAGNTTRPRAHCCGARGSRGTRDGPSSRRWRVFEATSEALRRITSGRWIMRSSCGGSPSEGPVGWQQITPGRPRIGCETRPVEGRVRPSFAMGWGLSTGQVKISSVAKKNKKNQDLPEGMSRRQAKLAARAAERAKLQRDARPYAGFAMESDIIALQEFVPSARVKVEVKGIDFPVSLVTVLPGAVAAMRRAAEDGGEGFVALQTQRPGDNPTRDLAYALNWLKTAEPGAALEVGVADGNEPELTNLLDPKADEEIIVEQDFNWWLTEEHQDNPQVAATLRRANDSVLPSEKVRADIKGAAWWIDPGER